MRLTVLSFLIIALAGCFRAPRAPELPPPRGGASSFIPPLTAGGYVEYYGYAMMAGGLALLIVCIFLVNFGLKRIAKPLALSAVGVVGCGVALVYIGPWLAWIFAAFAITIIAALVWVVSRNWRGWLTKAEAATGLDLDGRP